MPDNYIFSRYRDIQDWVIIDQDTIHDFGDLEMEIPIVNVLIGVLYLKNNHRTPITRWMTVEKYYKYKENV